MESTRPCSGSRTAIQPPCLRSDTRCWPRSIRPTGASHASSGRALHRHFGCWCLASMRCAKHPSWLVRRWRRLQRLRRRWPACNHRRRRPRLPPHPRAMSTRQARPGQTGRTRLAMRRCRSCKRVCATSSPAMTTCCSWSACCCPRSCGARRRAGSRWTGWRRPCGRWPASSPHSRRPTRSRSPWRRRARPRWRRHSSSRRLPSPSSWPRSTTCGRSSEAAARS